MTTVDNFNKTIKEIFKIFKELPSQKFKSKLHIAELQSKMVKGMRTEELYALIALKNILWDARKEIASDDYDFFLNYRYEMGLQKFCKQHAVNYDNGINAVWFMKDAFQTASLETKALIFTHLKELLRLAAEYMLNG